MSAGDTKRRGFPGRRPDNNGYIQLWDPDSPGASNYTQEHRVIVERALGRPLPAGAVVHHVNGDKKDNRPENLVACENSSYHSLLHARAAAWEACGNPGWRRCAYCGSHDDPVAMVRPGDSFWHNECKLRYKVLSSIRHGRRNKYRHTQYGWISLIQALWPNGVPPALLPRRQ